MLRLWDANSGKEIVSIKDGSSGRMAMSHDGKLVASVGGPNVIVFWDGTTGKKLRQTTAGVFDALAFSPDGTVLASGESEGHIRLWDVATATELLMLKGHRGGVRALAFSAADRLASAGADTTVLIWDLARAAGGVKADAPAGKQRSAAWDDLAGTDGRAAYWAGLVFRRDPTEAVALFGENLRPSPEVSATRLRELLRDLDDDSFAKREKATQALKRLGPAADAELRAALKGDPSPELKIRVMALLAAISPPADAQERRSLRAIGLLEEFGTAKARSLLDSLSRGKATTQQTQAARAARARLAAGAKP